MQEETLNNINEAVAEAPAEATTPTEVPTTEAPAEDAKDTRGRRPMKRSPRQSRPPRVPREKPEFESKAIGIRRVTRVVTGGRRFALHVTMVIGDRNGRVGLGTGKAIDTQIAMDKAMKSAKKNMLHFKLDDKKTIPHEVSAKYDTAKVWISPNKGKGLVAGSSARVILALAGFQNITAKFHGGTKNKLNNARATMKALAQVAGR